MTAYPSSSRSQLPPVSYIVPVLMTIFCCLAGGILSIIFTAKANAAAVSGDAAAYTAYMGQRKLWMMVTLALAVVGALGSAIYYAVSGGAGG
jgi:predicted alpha/beta hydrolase